MYRKGEIVQHIQNLEVLQDQTNKKNIITDKELKVRDIDTNIEFTISGNELINSLNDAINYTKVEKCGQTQLIDQLKRTRGKIFSSEYTKKDGSKRVMQAIYAGPDKVDMGRSMAVDLEAAKEGKPSLKQIDHRTLEWIICDNTKYTK